jgi:cell fate (sporulation/competence/biofilm development) regulator YlbF (YheA/YmcA/DUF963 family)
MEILPSRAKLHNDFIRAREEIQKWIDTHVMPSRCFIASERNLREQKEYENLMKKFKESEEALLKDLENLNAKDISKINEILLIKQT